ncbi:hypothetical protein ABPG72_015001 [Tetrahymena utriculariae]
MNKQQTMPQSTVPLKKTVPQFLQKNKDSQQNKQQSSSFVQPQSQNFPPNSFQSPQSTAQKMANPNKQIKSLNQKDSNIPEQKELFPFLSKAREKDPRQLGVNIQKCQEVYDFYKRLIDCEMPVKELGNALRSLGYLVNTTEIGELQQKLQKQKMQINQMASVIEFKDFLVAVSLVQHKLPNEKELQEALKLFVKHKEYDVNRETLKGVITKIGDIITEKEFDTLFPGIMTDQKGNIPIQKITSILLRQPQN